MTDVAAAQAAMDKYRRDIARIDAEIKQERERRLMAAKVEVGTVFAQARANGVKLAILKEIYGTRDHRTVKTLVELGEAAVASATTLAPMTQETASKFEVAGNQLFIQVDDKRYTFDIHEMEGDGRVILAAQQDEYPDGIEGERDMIVADWDGRTLPDEIETPEHEHVYKLISGQ